MSDNDTEVQPWSEAGIRHLVRSEMEKQNVVRRNELTKKVGDLRAEVMTTLKGLHRDLDGKIKKLATKLGTDMTTLAFPVIGFLAMEADRDDVESKIKKGLNQQAKTLRERFFPLAEEKQAKEAEKRAPAILTGKDLH